MVFDGGNVARGFAGRAVYGGDKFNRALWTGAGSGVSVGACRGIVSGAVGSVATQEMVVLGDGAAGDLHVHVDGVGAVSLCGGYFWRNYDGDGGVSDWEMDHAEAGGGGDGG